MCTFINASILMYTHMHTYSDVFIYMSAQWMCMTVVSHTHTHTHTHLIGATKYSSESALSTWHGVLTIYPDIRVGFVFIVVGYVQVRGYLKRRNAYETQLPMTNLPTPGRSTQKSDRLSHCLSNKGSEHQDSPPIPCQPPPPTSCICTLGALSKHRRFSRTEFLTFDK